MNLTFAFQGHEIRCVGTADRPEWIARDVAEVLGISQSTLSERIAKMPDDWKGIGLTDTPGGIQEMTTVLEPGLYELIFRSDKPEANKFQRWVFEEVLPAIRQTGSYVVKSATRSWDDGVLETPFDCLKTRVGLFKNRADGLEKQHQILNLCMDEPSLTYTLVENVWSAGWLAQHEAEQVIRTARIVMDLAFRGQL